MRETFLLWCSWWCYWCYCCCCCCCCAYLVASWWLWHPNDSTSRSDQDNDLYFHRKARFPSKAKTTGALQGPDSLRTLATALSGTGCPPLSSHAARLRFCFTSSLLLASSTRMLKTGCPMPSDNLIVMLIEGSAGRTILRLVRVQRRTLSNEWQVVDVESPALWARRGLCWCAWRLRT